MAEKVLLVRHALSGGNIEGKIQGQTNTPLRQGYKTNADRLADLVIAQEHLAPQTTSVVVYCSELDRAYYTADRIHRGLTDKKVQAELLIRPTITERGAGILEGKMYMEAIPILQGLLPPSTDLQPNAESIYPYLYALNNIPRGEKHENLGERLQEFLIELQRLKGIVFVVGHGISGMNNLKNLMTDGNILGAPPQPYQHFPNLSVVRLESDGASYARYIVTGRYGPPQNDKANGGQAENVIAGPLVQAVR